MAFDIVQFKEGRLCGCCGPVITKVACATALMLVTLLLPIVLVFCVINQLEPGSQVCLSARLVTDDHNYHALNHLLTPVHCVPRLPYTSDRLESAD